jgi:hypothetical protein
MLATLVIVKLDQTDSGDEAFAAAVAALVQRTTSEQGVPVGLADPTTLHRIAILMDQEADRPLSRQCDRDQHVEPGRRAS